MLDLYCWKHGPDGADRAAPQLGAGQHVGFVHRAEPARAAFGPREAKRRDAFNLRGGVGFGVEGALDTSLHLVPALTEVHSAGQLANNFNVQIAEAFRLHWRNASQRLASPHRSPIPPHPNAFSPPQ